MKKSSPGSPCRMIVSPLRKFTCSSESAIVKRSQLSKFSSRGTFDRNSSYIFLFRIVLPCKSEQKTARPRNNCLATRWNAGAKQSRVAVAKANGGLRAILSRWEIALRFLQREANVASALICTSVFVLQKRNTRAAFCSFLLLLRFSVLCCPVCSACFTFWIVTTFAAARLTHSRFPSR